MVLRRDFMKGLLAAGGLLAEAGGQTGPRRRGGAGRIDRIDRAALVGRYNPVAQKIDPLSPLSVGNGEFAFTADVTGLQTFPEEYKGAMPLCTMAQWGWHTTPHRAGLDPGSLRPNTYETHGRQVGYHTRSEGQAELFNWLRENPHRLHLGRVGFRLLNPEGGEVRPSDLTNVEQKLDLWAGVLESRFEVEGVPFMVRTSVHPRTDLLAVSVESPSMRDGRVAVRLSFPYGSPSMKAADWEQPSKHSSKHTRQGAGRVEIARKLDADEYFVTAAWEGPATLTPFGARETWNPTYELAYWSFGLKTAQRWRERLGLARNPLWDRVVDGLSPLPERGGVYLAHENCPQTFTERNYDHPSMLAALGVLPGDGVDRETMRRTLRKALAEWQWDKTWGWDYPLTAMTAARLDEPALAVDALLMKTEKNRYLPNGHNWQRANLPCYLPGNGGLLYAVALMASGWRGSPRRHAPGFPADGSWEVRWESLNSALTSQL